MKVTIQSVLQKKIRYPSKNIHTALCARNWKTKQFAPLAPQTLTKTHVTQHITRELRTSLQSFGVQLTPARDTLALWLSARW